ncbi:hypothetical protein PTT81_004072 [Escherichia coli]|nr:hypothetical protein [Escherichia coli]
MNESYYFRTSDPDYIRHAPSTLEILSKAFPTIITQQESEHELQRLIHLLNKLKGSNRGYDVIAQKLRQCRNESPCNSLICPHCQRERILAQLAMLPVLPGNSVEYVGVVLFFNKDTQTPPPWKNTDALRAQIGRYKQRISRVLNRLGYAGPATGTFSMMRHMPDGSEERIFWVPQLCLFLPNDSTWIKGLKTHMSRSGGALIDASVVNTPMIVLRLKDPARLLSCALNPVWYKADYTLTDKDALVKSRMEPLKGRTLLKSLLTLDSLGTGVVSFSFGQPPGKVH